MSDLDNIEDVIRLKRTARGLDVPKSTRNMFADMVSEIELVINSYSLYKIHASQVIGSLAKRTAVNTYHDVDVVLYVDGISAINRDAYAVVLKEFVCALKEGYRRDVKYLRRWDMFIRATIKGISYDLIIAPIGFQASELVCAYSQAENVMEAIFESKNPWEHSRLLGTVCSVASVDFIRNQNDSRRDAMRLLKYWCKKMVNFPEKKYVPGRMAIIECLTVHAAIEAEKRGCQGNVGCIMRKFWENLMDIKNIKVCFNPDLMEKFRGHKMIRFKPPYIIEPSNVFNNMLHSKKQFIRENIKLFLRELEKNGRTIMTKGHGSCWCKEYAKIIESYNEEFNDEIDVGTY